MEQLKQIRQLDKDGIGIREIARRCGISRNSVRKYLSLIKKDETDSNEDLTNKQLAQKAYSSDDAEHNAERLQQLISYLKEAEHELSKTGVTRQLLWKEYLQRHPDGYAYSHYCYHLKQYLKHTDVTMHLEYNAADMIMVDFAGKKLPYVDVSTGECIGCQVFIAILPFSGLIFSCAVHTQQTSDFTSCINAMLRFYAGVPATILCDNLRTAVNRPSRFEPVFTELCYQLSEHYSTTFSATRLTVPVIKQWWKRQ